MGRTTPGVYARRGRRKKREADLVSSGRARYYVSNHIPQGLSSPLNSPFFQGNLNGSLICFRRAWPLSRWRSICCCVGRSLAWGDLVRPTAEDHAIAQEVAWLMEKQHLSRHPLDKEISQRCLKKFLKTLDPMKVYFYQSDIDEFTKHQDELAAGEQRATSASPTRFSIRFLSRSTSG